MSLFNDHFSMKESSTYQAILAEGRLEGAIAEAKKVVRILAEHAIGPPDAKSAAALAGLTDLAQLESLFLRALTAANWQDLLGTSVPTRRKRRSRS